MRKWIALGFVSMIFLTGCGNKEAKLMGTWKSETKSAQGAAELELKADHKFSVTGIAPMTGTWKFADDKVQLTIEMVAGQPIKTMIDQLSKAGLKPQAETLSKPIDGKVSDDMASLTITNPGGVPVTFKKA